MTQILLVGCGKMGSALLRGWMARDVGPKSVNVVEPDSEAARELRSHFGVAVASSPEGLAPEMTADVVVFAVKPQALDEIAPHYRRFVDPGTVFLSIAAGKPVGFFERHLGEQAAIVRTMPNTPAAVGRGITAAFANERVTGNQREVCRQLLRAVGEVVWVDDEALLDAVTAVSGSGPAYVFLLIECLARAGVECGLPEDAAMRLARATVIGSGELAVQSDETAETLRRNVTSPGGTTEAALDVLMAEDGLQKLMNRAVAAAADRSRELAS